MRASTDFDPADPTEMEPFGFDFANELTVGEAIVSVESFTVDLIYGTDPDYRLRLSGVPGFDGTLVSCMAGGFQPDCTYRLTATVTTTLAKSLTLYADVAGEEL